MMVDEYADTYEGGQLGLAVPGEQRSLLPRPLGIPNRCVQCDRLMPDGESGGYCSRCTWAAEPKEER